MKANNFFFVVLTMATLVVGSAPVFQTQAVAVAFSAQAEVSAERRAQQIIQQARRAINRGVNPEEVRSYAAQWQSRRIWELTREEAARRGRETEQYERAIILEILLPDKLRWSEQSDFTTNQSSRTEILNGDQARSESAALIDGRQVSVQLGESEPPSRTAARMKSRLLSQSLITLLAAPPQMPLRFTYIGEAESSDQRADVVEANTTDGTRLRLYFDKTSHLLLMMSYIGRNGGETQKVFLSDYRAENNLLVAHRVTIEVDGRTVEERELRNFSVNPSFNSSRFALR